MKHLKLFGNANELKTYVEGTEYLEPFVGTDVQGGGVKYNRATKNIIRLFVEGSEEVKIIKGEFDPFSSDFFFLHNGWNDLDMNGEFKEGITINDTIGGQNTQKITQIDFSKFTGRDLNNCTFNNTGVEEIILPDTIEEIRNNCFYQNLLLKKVIFSKNIKHILSEVFYNCHNLTEISLHEGIVDIGDSAFRDTHIEKLIIPSTVKNIGDFVYSYYSDGGDRKKGSIRFQSLTPPEFTFYIFDQIDSIEVPMAAVETYKNINIPGWKEKFGDKIVGY